MIVIIQFYYEWMSTSWTQNLKPHLYRENSLRVEIWTWVDLNMWVKVNLLCVQTRFMYREQISETSFKIKKIDCFILVNVHRKWCVSLLFEHIGLAGGCSRLRETKNKPSIPTSVYTDPQYYHLFRRKLKWRILEWGGELSGNRFRQNMPG